MSLEIKFSEDIKKFTDPRYNPDNKCFFLKGPDMEIEIPYLLDFKDDYLPDDFQVFLFAKKDLHENDIYQLFEKSMRKRIGWIFPLQALQSLEHTYASDEHFLKYAAVAFHLICKGIEDINNKIPDYNADGVYKISDFYHENSVIICVCKNQIPNYKNFSIDNYLPSLFKRGYFLQVKRDPEYIAIRIDDERDEPTKTIRIAQTASSLQNKAFIKSLLSEVLPYENSNLLSFFFLYQVIELLMEEIRIIVINNYVKTMIENKGNPYKCKDILDKISHSYSEKNILRLLIDNHLKNIDKADIENLGNACNGFLEKYQKKTGTAFWDNLYTVRNLLFHQYRDIDQKDSQYIDEIITHFRLVIAEMLMHYDPCQTSQAENDS